MFSYSTEYYVPPPIDQFLKFKNHCSLMARVSLHMAPGLTFKHPGELARLQGGGGSTAPMSLHGPRVSLHVFRASLHYIDTDI